MEKIYMENNNKKKKSFFKKLMGSNSSVIMSFALAFLAIASVITYGFTQISYALPTADTLPASFPTKTYDSSKDRFTGYANAAYDLSIAIDRHYAVVGGKNLPVYCLQQNVAFMDGATDDKPYNKAEDITDTGLLYLLANLYDGTEYKMKTTETVTGNSDNNIESWITQAAIWVYLTETKTDSTANALSATQLANIRNTSFIGATGVLATDTANKIGFSDSSKKFFDLYKSNGISINDLIKNAKTKTGTTALNVDISKKSNDISISSDEKYYQTDLITINGTVADSSIGSFNGFNLKLTNAPEGTIVVDKDGKELASLNDLASGTQVYIRVPVDKVTEENKKVGISVTGSFKVLSGTKYVYDGKQTIATVKTVNKDVIAPLDIEINYTPDVPDTGMSAAQSIYFIGLIVLLSGVGIIYANVKPSKQN